MNRTPWIDYLRSSVTVLVLAHHAALAYTTFSWFDPVTYINSTHPVVDSERSRSLDFFTGFNDNFFMPLMFFLSGVVTYRSILTKGKPRFIKDRLLRIGLPFVVAELIIIPLAYLPPYFINTKEPGLWHFVQDYLFHQSWPVGPPWFLWLLLLFNLLILIPKTAFFSHIHGQLQIWATKPGRLFWLIAALMAIAYIPISMWLGQYKWTGLGVFDFQVNRFLFYFMSFTIGICVGSSSDRNMRLLHQLLLQKHWGFWLLLSLLMNGSIIAFNLKGWQLLGEGHLSAPVANLLFGILFVGCCIFSNLLFLSVFRQVVSGSSSSFSNLSANAYGIYILHYVFTTWSQYLLLPYALSPILKFFIVFLLSLMGSWWLTSLLKRIPVVAKYI